ncbi:MAG: chemotaxis protein CheA [Candidatus Wallbacteria bacterium]
MVKNLSNNTNEKKVPRKIKISSADQAAAMLINADAPDYIGVSEVADYIQNVIAEYNPSGEIGALVFNIFTEALNKLKEAIKLKDESPINTKAIEELLGAAGRLFEAGKSYYESDSPKLKSEIKTPDSKPNLDTENNAGMTMNLSNNPISSQNSDTNPAAQNNVANSQPSVNLNNELLPEFVNESLEHVEKAEAALLTLENSPDDRDSIDTVFRAFHTIKGSAAFLGLDYIVKLAHQAESMLSKIREGTLQYSAFISDSALSAIDMLSLMIKGAQSGKLYKPENFDDLLKKIESPELNINIASGNSNSNNDIDNNINKTENNAAAAITPAGNPAESQTGQTSSTKNSQPSISDEESMLRIKTDRVDKLIDMIGELVIAHSMVMQDSFVKTGINHNLQKKVMRTSKIIRELQDLSMLMRMVQFKSLFQKMARLVRDTSKKTGKAIEFITSGHETEVDRNIVDTLNDALIHMIRNSIDHGIEPAGQRSAQNKPARGAITLSAFHEGGNIVLKLSDDGQGLDRDKILNKALEKGIIKSAQGLNENDVFNLIFLPGFSTNDKVTSLSGRGVGMDVVKKAVEKLHGKIEISSIKNKGTTFTIRLPLTMAITDGMLIRVGTQKFIIPTINIKMTIKPQKEQISIISGSGELIAFRGKMLPIFRLKKVFEINEGEDLIENGIIIILEDNQTTCAFFVDELLGQYQVVVKPLGAGIGKIDGISGGAILGDGRVGLIIEPSELIEQAKLLAVPVAA